MFLQNYFNIVSPFYFCQLSISFIYCMKLLFYLKCRILVEMEVTNVFPTVSSSRSSINISWTVQEKCHCYKVKYREFSDKKTFQVESTFECQIIIRNLKCKTVYEIKVYIEDEDGNESCLFSTETQTTESSAIWLTELADKITDGPIPVYQLRATTEMEIGNEKKVKVYEYCKFRLQLQLFTIQCI